MIELSRHIERLLLAHDCVIIPELGGLVTQYVPARYVDGEQLYLPPYRCVGFNPHLQLNDGLLVQSYMKAYDTSYPEAERLVRDAVSQIKTRLREQGEFELAGIGTLALNMEGHYTFRPNEAGVVSPELYGLDSFTLPRHEGVEAAQREHHDKERLKQLLRVNRTERSYTLSVSREIVNYVAAAVVAVVFYLVWAIPIRQESASAPQEAAVVSEQLFGKTAQPKAAVPQQTQPQQKAEAEENNTEENTQAAVPESEAPASENEAPAPAKTEAQKVAAERTPMEQKGYTIVLASAISKKNAQAYSEQLAKDGLKAARPMSKGRMTRVVYGQFPTEEAARKEMNRLKDQAPFKDAWVMPTTF